MTQHPYGNRQSRYAKGHRGLQPWQVTASCSTVFTSEASSEMETLVSSFLHENQSYPPYSSQYGNLRYTKKFDLIECLTKRITETSRRHGGWRSRIGACTTNGIRFNVWWVCKGQVFIPVVTGALRSALRTDIAWGDYRPESLKENTRQKRKTGVRNEVAEHVKMPRNWKSFLGGAGWTRKSCYSSSLLMLADTPSLPTSK